MLRGWTGAAVVAALSWVGSPGQAQDLSTLPGAEQYGLRLQYREYRPSLTGEAQKGSGDRDGTVVDMVDDLGIADARTFDARGAIQFKRGWKLRGSYTPLDYQGDVEAQRAFNYGDTRYARFDRVVTRIKGSYFSADLEWDFVKGRHGFLGLIVGAKVFDIDANVLDASINAREVDTVLAPIPVVGLATRLYAGRLSFEGELAGMSAGSRGSAIEAEGSMRIHLSDRLAAMGGYRYLSLDGRDGSDQVKLKLGGWQFGVEISL
ncbi:MAG TPA: hypothetical protein VMR21_06045 [Vicinamibacteria bacterium]|nr:hypothetical protein [Vicinamibacteria bacterium]